MSVISGAYREATFAGGVMSLAEANWVMEESIACWFAGAPSESAAMPASMRTTPPGALCPDSQYWVGTWIGTPSPISGTSKRPRNSIPLKTNHNKFAYL